MGRGRVQLSCASPVVLEGLRAVVHEAGWETTTDGAVDIAASVVFVRTSLGVAEVRAARELDRELPVVAITEHDDPELIADTVQAGATSVVAWETSPDDLVSVLDLAAGGISALPTTALHWIGEHGGGDPLLSDAEKNWLRHLADGITIAELAPIAGYSERSLYRQLNGMYHRLGVEDRFGAIAEARRRGLID